MVKLSIIFLLMIPVISLQAQQSVNTGKDKIAVQGYDVVAYFDDQAIPGTDENVSEYEGIRYLFSSAANKARFDQMPGKYAPQYGGWCAYAMGKTGKYVKINPESYKILDDKLFLFYKTKKVNTLTLWNEDELSLYQRADQNWQSKK